MIPPSWITLYPQWYAEERQRLARHFPGFRPDEERLRDGRLILYGELLVRPPGGTHRHPVALIYPAATPYEQPRVLPLETLPSMNENGAIGDKLAKKQYDYRYQMPDGALCLFQRETRAEPGGDIVSGVDALRRAARWFLGVHTGHWPPDSAESEFEAHFQHVTDILLSETLYSGALEGSYGHFYFTRDYRRAIDVPTDDCPMIVTSLTIERDGILEVVDTRDELQRVYPWIRGEAWGTTTVIDSETRGATAFDPVEHGYWWSLPEEPRPFTDGGGLLRELRRGLAGQDPWEAVQIAFGTRMTTEARHHIAPRYPGRHGSPEWLVVIVATGARRESGGFIYETDLDKKARFEAGLVGGVHVHSVNPSTLNLRNTGYRGGGTGHCRQDSRANRAGSLGIRGSGILSQGRGKRLSIV